MNPYHEEGLTGQAGVIQVFIIDTFLFTDLLRVDKISSTNPRVIEDQRARQLCIDVRHSLFYETCATYGFNVDRVFAEGELTHAQNNRLEDVIHKEDKKIII